MKKAFLLLIISLLIAGCGGGGGMVPKINIPAANNPPAEETTLVPSEITMLRSAKPRETGPAVSDSTLAELIKSNNGFATDMYRELRSNSQYAGKNIFFSPYSISVASAMLFAGAKNNTAKQMKDVFHITLPNNDYHSAFNKLGLAIENQGKDKDGNDTGDFKLNIVNSFWGQKNYKFLADYLDVLSINYDAGISLLDFASGPGSARKTINDWIEKETNGIFKGVLSEGSITTLTRLVLTNAIYFNALWSHPFPTQFTGNKPFNLLGGGTKQIETMILYEEYFRAPYIDGDGYKAAELDYKGTTLSMLLIVPDAGKFDNFESSFNADKIKSIHQELKSEYLELHLPKFDFETDIDLYQTLTAMGMTDAFLASKADFSGIDGTRNL